MKNAISIGTLITIAAFCFTGSRNGVQARSPRVMIPSYSFYYEEQPQPQPQPQLKAPQVSQTYQETRFQAVHNAPGEVKIVSNSKAPQVSQPYQETRFQAIHKAPGEVKIVSKSTYTDGSNFIGGVSTGKNNRVGDSRRKKVDVEKFKECIFFRLCSKAQCFHYGRHNTCE